MFLISALDDCLQRILWMLLSVKFCIPDNKNQILCNFTLRNMVVVVKLLNLSGAPTAVGSVFTSDTLLLCLLIIHVNAVVRQRWRQIQENHFFFEKQLFSCCFAPLSIRYEFYTIYKSLLLFYKHFTQNINICASTKLELLVCSLCSQNIAHWLHQ